MVLNFSHPIATGIEIGDSKVKVASLQKKKNAYEVLCLKEYSLPLSEENAKTIEKLIAKGPLVSAIDARHLLVRPLDIKLKEKGDIEAALPFQIEPLLPYEVEKALLSYQVKEKYSQGMLLSIFSVRKDHLIEHLEKLKSFSIEPEITTSLPISLALLSSFLSTEKGAHLILHIGDEKSCALIADQGKLVASHPIHVGLKDKENEVFEKEIGKTLRAIEVQHKCDFILLVSESTDFIENIQKIIGKPLVLPAFSPFKLSSSELASFAAPLGAALTYFSEKSVNFRQKEFSYPHRWKRLKKPLGVYFTFCALISILLLYLGSLSLENKRTHIRSEIKELLSHYSTLSYSPEINENLAVLASHIKNRSNSFPYLPRVPNLSQLLSFLSQFETSGDSLKIETIHYILERFPSIQNNKEHYLVKVDLEATASHPTHARAFYDFLLQQKSFIDLQKEVKWQNEKGRYKASFYLLDKTTYV